MEMKQIEEIDVLVIGAGPSGTVAASHVHQGGLSVHIVEKQRFPRFVIGESLLPRCMESLNSAGFLEAIESRGFQKKDGAKFVHRGQVCDFDFKNQFSPGWNWTWQVPRAEMDQAMAEECERMGIPVHYEIEVVDIRFEGDHSIARLRQADGQEFQVRARFVIDGSGYGRVIPRMLNLDRPSTQPPRKTLLSHLGDPRRAETSQPNRITIYARERETWIWVIPFSNGITSLGFVSEPEFFDDFPQDPRQAYQAMLQLEPELAYRFENPDFQFEPRVLQGWSVKTDRYYGPGFVLTGNATEFLDPVFSSGVTLAVVSAELAGKLVVRQLKHGESVDWEQDYAGIIRQGVDVFRTYVNAWYDGTLLDVFFAKNPDPENMSRICSVLSGYVWDQNNSFVRHHEKSLRTLHRYITQPQGNPQKWGS